MILDREKVMSWIQEMPQRFTIDEVIERILFMVKVEKGLNQISKGNSYSQE